MRRVLVFLFCSGAFVLIASGAPASQPTSFQRSPDSGAAGTTITVSAAGCNQPLAGAGLVGNPGGVVPVQNETAPTGGSWSVQLALPQGIDPNLDYVVVARCGNPDAGGFFYSPDLPFDVLPSGAAGVPGQPRMTG
jgi:hypothetical protein